MMEELPFTVKYKPHTIDGLLINSSRIKKILNLYADGKIGKHLLLHGNVGTGKSAAMDIIARQRLGKTFSFDALLIDVSFRGDVNKFQSKVSTFCGQNTITGDGRRIIMIDEIDQFCKRPTFAEVLQEVMVRWEFSTFFMATSNNYDDLPLPIQDRFSEHPLDGVPYELKKELAERIMEGEGFTLSDDELADFLAPVVSFRGVCDAMEIEKALVGA